MHWRLTYEIEVIFLGDDESEEREEIDESEEGEVVQGVDMSRLQQTSKPSTHPHQLEISARYSVLFI